MLSEQQRKINQAKYAGYRQGRNGNWPDWMPPYPEDAALQKLFKAAESLRNTCDCFLAQCDPDDEISTTIGPPMDAVTEALQDIDVWLKCGLTEAVATTG